MEDWHRFLFVDFDKPERLRALAQIADHVGEKRFWHLFGQVWTGSESLFMDQDIIAKLLRRREDSPFRGLMMDRKERAEYRRLPATLRVHRGCWDENRQGWSWTLAYDKAKWFANRCPVDGKPLVVSGTLAKAHAIAYLTGRDEQEIVADPRHVQVYRTRSLRPVTLTQVQAMFLLAQTGRLAPGMENPLVREMMISNMKTNGIDLNRLLTEVDARIERYARYGFADKVSAWREYRASATKVYAEGYQFPGS